MGESDFISQSHGTKNYSHLKFLRKHFLSALKAVNLLSLFL